MQNSEDYASFMHEIKNPLNAIYSVAQLLELENGKVTQKDLNDYVNLLIRSINSIKEIERDFDEYRKTGKMLLARTTVNINLLIYQILEEFITDIQNHGIHVKTNIKVARAYTDANKLKQVLRNIISNAIKYRKIKPTILTRRASSGLIEQGKTSMSNSVVDVLSPKGNDILDDTSPQIYIECKTHSNDKGSYVKIIIQDNGIGMDERELERLGTPFYRSKRVDQPGTGLGISIVKKIATCLNWDINIKSQLGKGTIISIMLHHILG